MNKEKDTDDGVVVKFHPNHFFNHHKKKDHDRARSTQTHTTNSYKNTQSSLGIGKQPSESYLWRNQNADEFEPITISPESKSKKEPIRKFLDFEVSYCQMSKFYISQTLNRRPRMNKCSVTETNQSS